MNGEFPAYYCSLAPFQAWFEQGNPILTYHKLGPRPRHARLKGLYLPRALFARQLRELAARHGRLLPALLVLPQGSRATRESTDMVSVLAYLPSPFFRFRRARHDDLGTSTRRHFRLPAAPLSPV